MDVSFAEMHSWGTSVRKVPSRLAPNPPFYSCPTIFSTPPTGEVAAGEFADLSLPCPSGLIAPDTVPDESKGRYITNVLMSPGSLNFQSSSLFVNHQRPLFFGEDVLLAHDIEPSIAKLKMPDQSPICTFHVPTSRFAKSSSVLSAQESFCNFSIRVSLNGSRSFFCSDH